MLGRASIAFRLHAHLRLPLHLLSTPHSFPGRKSWDVFGEILQRCNIVTTPGSGFGAAGEGFVRVSAFGRREDIEEAVTRFQAAYKAA